MAVRHEPGRDAVGKAALFADLLHQPAAEPAAPENLVEHQRGVPVRIVALQPGLAEGHRALRHGAALDEQRAAIARGCLGQDRIALAFRQIAENAVKKRRQLRRGNIADGADNERVALELARRERDQIVARDRRDGRPAAGGVPRHRGAVRMPRRIHRRPDSERGLRACFSRAASVSARMRSTASSAKCGSVRATRSRSALSSELALSMRRVPSNSSCPAEKLISAASSSSRRWNAVVSYSPGPFVEQRGRERGGAVLAGRVETRPADKGEPQRHDRDRMIPDQPRLDPARARDALDLHRRGLADRPGGQQDQERQPSPEQSIDRSVRPTICPVLHDVRSGSRMPVTELRSTNTARAASWICAGVTAPMRSGHARHRRASARSQARRRRYSLDRPGCRGHRSPRPACAAAARLTSSGVDALFGDLTQLRLDRRFEIGDADPRLSAPRIPRMSSARARSASSRRRR